MYSAPLTIGIEEEYQLIDPSTGELAAVVQKLLHDERVRQIGDQIKPELMQSQIEDWHGCLPQCAGSAHGAGALAPRGRYSSPSATATASSPPARTPSPVGKSSRPTCGRALSRPAKLHAGSRAAATDFRHARACRLWHGSPEQLDLLIDIQNQMRYFLPHLLAFSTSSPFWHGHATGLKELPQHHI